MIKAVVFFFFFTLYRGETPVWTNWGTYLKTAFKSVVKDEKRLEEICEKYDVKPSTSYINVLQICQNENLNLRKLKRYIRKHIYMHSHDKIQTISDEFLKKLKENHALYVVTLSDQPYVKYYSKKYNIDRKNFRKMYSLNFFEDHPSKGNVYAKIIKKEKISPKELLVIGDNFDNDIIPARKLGAKTLYFKGDYNQIYDYFKNGEK